jgi:hypothetical protein
LQARGAIAWWCNNGLLLLSGAALTGLLVFVVDSTLLCHRFITSLGRRASRLVWPTTVLDDQATAYGLTQQQRDEPAMSEALKRRALLRLVDRLTDPVAHMIYYPFIVLLLLVVAQNRLFEDWHWYVPLVLIALLSAAVALVCAVMLQRSARKVRDDALAQLTDLIQRRPAGTDPVKEKLVQLQSEVDGMNSGAFASLYQNPIVGALLLPLGGGGGLAALGFLLGH